ncbi:hypothetical protein D3Z62_21740 [Lachnospiraceae bacterium]|nr:hypothetical protein [Lachnospiraceae bacterium]
MEPPKKWIDRIVEATFMLMLSAFFIHTAVEWILEVWPVLAVIAAIIIAAVIVYRIWKYKHDGQW